MKRIVSLILALSMVLSMFTFSFAGEARELKDVEGTKYEAAVEALMELKVVEGYPDDTYLPDNVVTRAELAKLLVVAFGLKPAAEAAGSVTPFADANNHWASGYVNVSADYKFVNGYPDGSFQPDGTVTYAEAITMCLRVLGYANEVDSKGTWPTNYIAKAQDLKLMEDIDYGNYNNGAKRGDIALLIWNMLRTPMWEVTSESEGDGLVSRPERYMLNVKFSDYAYADNVTFEGFSIAEDSKDEVAKVYVELDCDCKSTLDCKHDFLELGALEYAGNDFYTFVEGTEVEVLVNEEEKTLLTMVPTGDNKVVNGAKEAYEDDYGYSSSVADLTDEAYDYIYAAISKKDATAFTVLNSSSVYVDEIEIDEDDEEISINDETLDAEDVEFYDYKYEEIVLRDGERVVDGLEGLEVGEVLTTVTVLYDGLTEDDFVARFHVIGAPEKVEGEFSRYALVAFEDSEAKYLQLTLGKSKYPVDSAATYVEDTEDYKLRDVKELKTGDDKMKGEEVVAKLDPVFGKVVRIEFDGEINGDEDDETTFKFVGIASRFMPKSDSEDYEYEVVLVSDDGSDDTYTIAANSAAATKAADYDDDKVSLKGTFAVVELNDENEVKDIQLVADYKDVYDLTDVTYGDSEDDEIYDLNLSEPVTFDEDKLVLADDTTYMTLDEGTILVRVIRDDNGSDDEEDFTYRVEFEKGIDAIEDMKIKKESVITVVDLADDFASAKYVVVPDDLSDHSDNQVALVATPDSETVYVGGEEIVLNTSNNLKDSDSEVVLEISKDTTKDLTDYKLVVYTVTTNSKDDEIFNYVAGLTQAELSDENTHGYVNKVSSNGKEIYLDGVRTHIKDTFEEDYEDYMYVIVEVTESSVDGEYKVKNYSKEDVGMTEAIEALEEGTRLSKDDAAEIIFVINGMDVIEEDGQ